MKIKSKLKDYSIEFEKDFSFIEPLLKKKNTIFVIDRAVYELYHDELFEGIDSSCLYILDAQESKKNIDTVLEICDIFASVSAKRNAALVSIGGGITQDITGFVANIMYRGIAWTYIPTTLLASADSCIGGKTSLNYGKFKNLLGTFYPPDKIIICSLFLQTLSDKDYKSGLGEVVKFNVMKGEKNFNLIEDAIDAILTRDYSILDGFIKTSLNYKKSIIEEDEFDKGKRIFLNFAHTFGHALETVSEYQVPHGTAVAIGMLLANNVSCARGLLNNDFAMRVNEVCKKIITLNLRPDWFEISAIVTAMRKDKKQINSNISVVLLEDGGTISVVDSVSNEEIDSALVKFRHGYLV